MKYQEDFSLILREIISCDFLDFIQACLYF
ncbi:hypothetical protein O203_23250 [Ectopseudomonas chengduensis]|nr:hypothetical protein O203_23250 [Pseudomonas chengduensis]